jgi:hypothetical protein
MKKYAMMAFIAFLTMSSALSAQDNRGRGQDGNRGQQREVRQNNNREQRETRQREAEQARQQRVTPQARAERMARELELTAEQKTRVQTMFENQEEIIRQHRQQNQQAQRRNQEEMRTRHQQAIAAHDAELEEIIGAEKMERWRRVRAETQRPAPRPTVR